MKHSDESQKRLQRKFLPPGKGRVAPIAAEEAVSAQSGTSGATKLGPRGVCCPVAARIPKALVKSQVKCVLRDHRASEIETTDYCCPLYVSTCSYIAYVDILKFNYA